MWWDTIVHGLALNVVTFKNYINTHIPPPPKKKEENRPKRNF